MPRALTNNQRAYLIKLLDRNSKEFNQALAKTGSYQRIKIDRGLSKPMSSKERKMRERIIQKVMPMAFDLVTIYHAGLLPNKTIRAKSASGLCDEVSSGLCIESLSGFDFSKCDSRVVTNRGG